MRKRGKHSRPDGGLIAKLRKPMAPPAKIEEDRRKYQRARERARSRRGR